LNTEKVNEIEKGGGKLPFGILRDIVLLNQARKNTKKKKEINEEIGDEI